MMDETSRRVLEGQGQLSVAAERLHDRDLYRLGLTLRAKCERDVAREEAFDVEVPDRLLRKRTFDSIGTIAAVLSELGVRADA